MSLPVRYRVVKPLVREPWKCQEVGVGEGEGLDNGHVQGGSAPGEGVMEEPGVEGACLDRYWVV